MAKKLAFSRILVALDASPECASALAMAADWAAKWHTELEALFIEDVNLFHLADLPFTREIDRVFAEERELNSLRIARALRAQVAQIRRTLDALTAKGKVPYSLRVVRGHYVAEALSAATPMDILLFGRMRSAPKAAARRLRAAWMDLGGQKSVGVIYSGRAGADRALALAEELAHTLDSRLIVFVLAADSAQAKRLQEQATKGLERMNEPLVHFIHAPTKDPTTLVQAVRRAGCTLLVVSHEDPDTADSMTQALLEGVECPMVLAP